MKIVLAPDKFKGSLTGMAFCNIVEEVLRKELPQSEILKIPLADGGDGTIAVLQDHLKGKPIELRVKDPLFRDIKAQYFYNEQSLTAYIEMAEASGLKLLSDNEKNCMYTSSYGTGQLIADALKKGCENIVLGIGGSATNDCGIGMAQALGYKFLNANGVELSPIGKNLAVVHKIDASNVNSLLHLVNFKIALDVNNVLYGSQGAAFVYGFQKGASLNEIKALDKGLKNMRQLFLSQFNKDVKAIPGTGAGGGMGAGAYVFLNAKLCSGINLIKDLINFDKKIKASNWIITGEGKLDATSFLGKTIGGVISSAQKQEIPVAALCGSIDISEKEIKEMGLSYSTSIMDKASSLDDAMHNCAFYLSKTALDFAKYVKSFGVY